LATSSTDLQIPVTTTKLRWTVTASSIGHLPDVQIAGFSSLGDPQQISCSEIQVFQIGPPPAATGYFPH
jgi:hypothetical protein